jgi:hypothetical protein
MNRAEVHAMICRSASEVDEAVNRLKDAVALLPDARERVTIEDQVWSECDRLSAIGAPIVAAQIANGFPQRSVSRIREYVRSWRASQRKLASAL